MMNETKQCPYCREEICADAVKCRYCKSVLVDDPRAGTECGRDLPGRMIAGVAVYMARTMGISTAVVRLGFVLLALMLPPLGFGAYGCVWAFTPYHAGGVKPIDRLLAELRRIIDGWEKRSVQREEERPVPATVPQEGR